MEAVTLAQVGFGPWGANLARNFDELAQLKWICELDEGRLENAASRFPRVQATAFLDDTLQDDEVDAVVIATAAPTHADLAARALTAGKHVFVEKPMAMSSVEAERLAALADRQRRVLMPGHLLLYHPGVEELARLVRSGELGDVLYVYGNRQNLGTIRRDENALWSLGVHDLSIILHLLEEEPSEVWARGDSFLKEGVEDVVFCYLRFPSGRLAHMHLSWLDPHKMRRLTVVGSQRMAVFDDMELERKVTVYDKAAEQPLSTYGEWRTRAGAIHSPLIPADEPLRLECLHFLQLIGGSGDAQRTAQNGVAVVRCLEALQRSLEPQLTP